MRALLLLFFLAYLLLGRWYFICEVRQQCTNPLGDNVRLKTLTFTDEDSLVYTGYDHFRFDTARIDPMLNENNRQFLDSIAFYLGNIGDRNLTITGAYMQKEASLESGFYENLGVARAAEIRELLQDRGLAEDRITLDYRLDRTNTLARPLTFKAYDPNAGNLERSAFTFTNMTFSDANFEFGSAEFKPGDPFITYADSVETYMEINPQIGMTIVGHADSIDTETFNYELGLDRARNARLYFTNLGIDKERIEVASKGETRPVADNGTDEGRQKNRRVEFILEKNSQ